MGIAIVWLTLCAVQTGDLDAQVREQVGRLSSENVDERERTVGALGRLGRAAIPLLRSHLAAADAETRARIKEAIERIQFTDPVFLVRPPTRTVTAELADASLDEAIRALFERFPQPPGIGTELRNDPVTTFSLSLDGASYWEAIHALEVATGLRCPQGTFIRPADGEREWTSKPGPFYRFTVRPADKNADVHLRVAMAFEPGWRPVYVAFEPRGVELAPGRIVREGIVPRPEYRGSEFCFTGAGFAWVPIAEGTLAKSDLKEGGRAVLRGTVRITLATRIEAYEYFPEKFAGSDERRIGECRVILREFKLDDRRVSGFFEAESPDGWQPPADRPYLSHVWRLLDDGKGHVQDLGCMRMASRTWSGLGHGEWPFAGRPNRLTLVRPMEVETLEVPLEIDFVPLPSK